MPVSSAPLFLLSALPNFDLDSLIFVSVTSLKVQLKTEKQYRDVVFYFFDFSNRGTHFPDIGGERKGSLSKDSPKNI